jgi:hypothetical protein
MSAGFGTENGLGTNGGPSFNTLRVPYAIAVEALTMPFIGHEVLVHKLDWAQINEVSRYLASATSAHPVRAYSTDG